MENICKERLIQFVFQPQIIRNHRDKLAICGLSAVVLDCIAEIGVEGIHVAAVPRDLDGVEAELVKACESV